MAKPFPSFTPKKKRDDLEYILISAISEVLFTSAMILLFFVFLPLPMIYASAGAITTLIFGSFTCWKSTRAAEAILYVSLFFSEYVIASHFNILIIPFIILDIIVVLLLTKAK